MVGNYLITGATGFIGFSYLEFLIKSEQKVHVLIRETSDLSKIKKLLPPENIHLYDGTYSSIDKILKENSIDHVVHLASLFLSSHNAEDVSALIDSNVKLGSFLLEAMKSNNVKNFVTTGTSWQHFHSSEYRAVCLYAATKEAFDKIGSFYSDAYNINFINLKLFDTYGPNDERKKLIFLLNKINASKEQLDMSPGEQEVDLVFIDDVISAIDQAIKLLALGEISGFKDYSICGNASLKLKEVVTIYEKVNDTKLNINWGGREYREREVMKLWSDGNQLPNWKAQVNLEEGLKRLNK